MILCREMGRLKHCQGAVLKRRCSPEAADVLNKLFDIALHDPHYLRFGYRPDCRLHGAEPVPGRTPPGLFSYSPVDADIPAGRSPPGRDRTTVVMASSAGEVNQRVYQQGGDDGGDGRSRTSCHQVSSYDILLTLTITSSLLST